AVAARRRRTQRRRAFRRPRADRNQSSGRLRHLGDRRRLRSARMSSDAIVAARPPAVNRSRALGGWLRRRVGALLVFAALFLLWEFAVHLFGIKEYLLPPPSKVWTEFLKRYTVVMPSAWVTLQEIVAGYLLAVVVSIPLALAVAYSRFMEQAVY